VSAAAAFFIEQILLFPGADSYRVLGARQAATAGELRRNMALLLRWLHPDLDPKGERSIFAGRVTKAWEDLKTPERRAVYDREQRALRKRKSRRHPNGDPKKPIVGTKPRASRLKHEFALRGAPRAGLLRRTLLALFGLSRQRWH
jgi:curved DNA-binding protein CbpA